MSENRRESRSGTEGAVAWVVLLALAGAASYEAAVALGALSVGSEPGEGPPGAEVVSVARC